MILDIFYQKIKKIKFDNSEKKKVDQKTSKNIFS